MRYPLFGAMLLIAACARPSNDFGSCKSVDALLDRQKSAIANAQSQLDKNLSLHDLQQELVPLVAEGEAFVDQCLVTFLDIGTDCLERNKFSRLQSVGGLLRALSVAPLSDSARDRLFVQRMLNTGRDESNKQLSGRSCITVVGPNNSFNPKPLRGSG